MIKNLYFYIFLGVVTLYFCYIKGGYNYFEGYRNAKVYIGNSPNPIQGLIYTNQNTFGSHSIYETGIIKNPDNYPGY